MSGGVNNIFVNDCSFIGTDIGLRFKTTRGRGGLVSNINIANINMSKIVGEAILFNMYYAAKDPIKLSDSDEDEPNYDIQEFTEATLIFKDISIKGVNCIGAKAALKITGLPESNFRI
ncbi:MAG: glycosyl hydrolase family 28 protein [Saprospiraceae bacterium]